MSEDFSRVGTHDLRLAELDALRGLAVVAVVLFHYTFSFDEIYGYPVAPLFTFPHGALGVQLFFAISGFVITWTTSRTRNVRDFFISRFSRLWPAYVVGIGLTWSTVAIFGLPGREVSPLQAMFNLTMVQKLFGVPHVDGAYWSLYIELIFYVWTALALTFGMLDRRIALVCVGLIAAMVLRAVQDAFGLTISGRVLKLVLAEFIPFFAVGILMFDARAVGRTRWYHLALLFASIAVAGYVNQRIDYAAAAALAALLIAGASSGALSFLVRRPFLFLGSISYSLYLVHQNIGYVLIRQALANGCTTELAIAIAMIFCVGLATLLRKFVEVPAQRTIRRWFRLRTAVAPS